MSKHTPGPWKVYYAKKSTDLPYEIFAPGSPEFKLRPLACVDSNGPNGEHYSANAHLIAAAPEMLDALKSLLEMQSRRERGDRPKLSEYSNAHANAIRAIVKAEGKS